MKNALSLVLFLILALCAKARTFSFNSDTSKIYTVVQKYPEFPGGESKFQEYIYDNQKGLNGSVDLKFVVEKDGALNHFKVIKSTDKHSSKEAIRLLKLSPKWNAGTINGQPVRVLFNFTVHFFSGWIDPRPDPPDTISAATLDPNMVFAAVEQMPEFPGGMEQFQKYIKRNIRYPVIALENKIEGKDFLTFIVEKNGRLTNIKVVRGIGNGCDEEAIRLMKKCPKWNPGMTDGRKVRVQYVVHVNFILPVKNYQ